MARRTGWKLLSGLVLTTALGVAILMAPAARGDEQLDQMMQNMGGKKSRSPVREAVEQTVESAYQGLGAITDQVSNWLFSARTPPAQDQDDFGNLFEDARTSEPGVMSQFWQQASEDVAKFRDALKQFPFQNPFWAPSIVGDYMEKGLGPAMDRVVNDP